MNKNTSNSSEGRALEVYHEYPKELHELHNDYSLASDKIDIKREMLSGYQLKMADLMTNLKVIISSIITYILIFVAVSNRL